MFSMDKYKRIWIGDVGWDTSESVKLMENIDKYYNFGWSIYEGSIHVKDKPLYHLMNLILQYGISSWQGNW